MFCFWTAYVAGFAVLNLQKNDAKYEASVLQQSGFLAYSWAESSATEWSFKLNKDSSIRSENCGGVEYNRIYSSMKVSAAAVCCTGRRGLGQGFMARSYEGDMSPRYAHPGQWSPPHCVGTRVTLSSSDADCWYFLHQHIEPIFYPIQSTPLSANT